MNITHNTIVKYFDSFLIMFSVYVYIYTHNVCFKMVKKSMYKALFSMLLSTISFFIIHKYDF
jgi:hypothetical protein